MQMLPTFVLLVALIKVCAGIRLPGLDDDTLMEGGPSAYIKFAASRGQLSLMEPTFKEAGNQDYTSGYLIGETTTTTPTTESGRRGRLMELLLDKIFGNGSWKSILKTLPVDTMPPPDVQRMDFKQNTNSNPSSSGFFSNQISASDMFKQQGYEGLQSTMSTEHRPIVENIPIINTGNNNKMLEAANRYTGGLINTNLHEITHEITAQSTTTLLPVVTFRNPITKTPPRISNILSLQESHQNEPLQQPMEHSNGFTSDLFDPNAVNHLTNSFNQNNNPSSFATQTGSNPQNSNWHVSFNADKVNSDNIKESKSHIETGLSPEVGQLPALQGKSDNANNEHAFHGFNNRLHVPNFDANELNRNLLNINWKLSSNMEPTFLTGETKTELSETHTSPLIKTETNDNNNVIEIADLISSSGMNKGNKDTAVQSLVSSINHRVETPQPQTHSVKTDFDFVPGNLYPGIVHNVREQNPHSSQNSIISLFNPNSVNAQQVVFNPNSISWVKTRTVSKRLINERKMNQNGQASEDSKDTFGNAPVGRNTIEPTLQDTTLVTTKSQTDIKESFGKPVPTKQSPLFSVTESKIGFNSNKVNIGQQSMNNFIPGQMSPYSSSSNQYVNGNAGTASFYKPTNASTNLLNFNIGSLLGMGSGHTSNIANAGLSGQFNPSSLNNMMMNPFSGNGNLTTGSEGRSSNGYSAGFDPNKANIGFSGALKGAGSGYSFGSAVSNNTTKWSQGSTFGSSFMTGGFDANAANAGFGDVLKGSTGVASNINNASESSAQMTGFGSGAAGGFNPNSANTGFGSTDYGMGGLNGPVGAFGGAYNADKMNSGLLGKESSSGDVKDMMNYFLGLKMKNEGGGNNGNENSGLYDSRYIGTFDPSSVNQVSYDPNRFNNVKVHLSPTEMLEKNIGMEKDALTSSVQLFDPDKVNSLFKDEAFNPNEMNLYISGVSHGMQDNPNKGVFAMQTGNSNSSANTNPAVFDPFEVMKQLMQASNNFRPGSAGNVDVKPTSAFPKTLSTTLKSISTQPPSSSSVPSVTATRTSIVPNLTAQTSTLFMSTTKTNPTSVNSLPEVTAINIPVARNTTTDG